MKKKVLAALLSAAMVATLLVGCGNSSAGNSSSSSDAGASTSAGAADTSGMSFEIVSKGLQHEYWQAVKKGVENKAAELGITINFVGPDSESNITQQVQQLESA